MPYGRDEILKTLEDHQTDLRQLGVRRLGLFGSCARGESLDDSDLDFVVDFERKSFDSYMEVKEFLEGLFDRPVDLVISDSIKPRLREAILGETIYASGL